MKFSVAVEKLFKGYIKAKKPFSLILLHEIYLQVPATIISPLWAWKNVIVL